jgi:hypothetical protein
LAAVHKLRQAAEVVTKLNLFLLEEEEYFLLRGKTNTYRWLKIEEQAMCIIT